MALKLFVVLFVLLKIASGLCPTKCNCSLDHKGRKMVVCKDGGIVGPLDLSEFSFDTEIIKITAPEDNMNALTMSPFVNYKNLEELYITRSNIPQLGQLFFWGLKKLDVLDLSQNNITQLLDHNFRGLSKLKELYLDDNRIYSLPSETFRYLSELKVLSIQRNRITELTPHIFKEVGKLKVLKLNGNNLKDLDPAVFKDVQELKSLECRGCALKHINNEIYHLLPYLSHLDLGDNELKSIDAQELKDLNSLKHLKLDGNHITAVINETFIHLPLLKRLNLTHNELSKLSVKAFEGLNNLTELDLSYNKLQYLPDDIFKPIEASLQILLLSGNYFKIDNLKMLENLDLNELHMVNCGIIDIPSPIFPQSLNILNLASNRLSTIQPEMLPTNLIELDISKNRFRGLDEPLLNIIEPVQTLKLDKNPWSCDMCHIIPLMERMNRSATIRNIKCTLPYTMQGKKLGTIEKSELTWCTASTYTPTDANFFLIGHDGKVGIIAASMSVSLLFLTILAIVGALLYSRRHAAKYYTHEDKLAVEGESIFENHSPLFCDGELSFKFPLDTPNSNGDRKISISTIDHEIKKEHSITNGT